MKTIKENWEGYLEKVYPDGTSVEQFKQVRAAFYGGSVATLAALMENTSLSDEEAEKHLQSMFNECEQFIVDHLQNPTHDTGTKGSV